MSEREARVVDAFLDCVRGGRFDAAYVTLLVEDNQKYGWMSETAKETLYAALENLEDEPDDALIDVDDDAILFGDELDEPEGE